MAKRRRRIAAKQAPVLAFLAAPLLLLALLFWPPGCISNSNNPTGQLTRERAIRVRLFQNLDSISVWANASPTLRAQSDSATRQVNFKTDARYDITLDATGWKIGTTSVGKGELTLWPATPQSFMIGQDKGTHYRGYYTFVPVGPNKFDVVNVLDIEDYLKGLAELPASWALEAHKAQAVAARTFALYEREYNRIHENRYWDVYADQRSQMYGGVDAENDNTRAAAEATFGMVVAYGAPGSERIFRAYYSSCCGGVSQSAADAFGEAASPLFAEQSVGNLCSASPKFNWGPIVVKKAELTRRFRLFGQRKTRPEKDIGTIVNVEVQQQNQFNRPIRFLVTDLNGHKYSLTGEDFRVACNTDALPGSTLFSSFVNVISDADSIHFVDGHGYGHGVGMCQWCAEARAKAGQSYQQIILLSYPGAVLKSAGY